MPNRKKPANISQKDWDDVDSPELTAADFRKMKPAAEFLPPAVFKTLAARQRGERGPQKAPTKVPTKLRIDPDVLEAYKATGRGWQTRMNEALREGLGMSKGRPGRHPQSNSGK